MLRIVTTLLLGVVAVWSPTPAHACSCATPATLDLLWPPPGELLGVDDGLVVRVSGLEVFPNTVSDPLVPISLRDSAGMEVAFDDVSYWTDGDCGASHFVLLPTAPLVDGETYTVDLGYEEPVAPESTATFTAGQAGGDRASSQFETHYTLVSHQEGGAGSCSLEAFAGQYSKTALLHVDPVGPGATVVASARNMDPALSHITFAAAGEQGFELRVPVLADDDCIEVTLTDHRGTTTAQAQVCQPDDCSATSWYPGESWDTDGEPGACNTAVTPGDDGCSAAKGTPLPMLLLAVFAVMLFWRRRDAVHVVRSPTLFHQPKSRPGECK